ncbi:carbohydrate ABC transporter permease [Litorilinea aerophila]|uniref:Carbohydrate ABC transporter permease n=1 Tax=Litorilinea aerophila TaxID=1204385 RepID=A0A540VCD2_9CHLR|nr:carbohydrate ABC transporter permease [Litorilinea aerophila]MCC9077814.1 carbohydrate ABC transporter permease [Litorilinea aerophila]GIV78998.1 MAG: sugar ABC transporter permease [Litorilinea sp.]
MTALLDRIPEGVFRVIAFVVIALLLGMILFPLYFMATTAFKVEREIYSELTWIPREPTLENFRAVIYSFRIPLYLRNTLIVALSTTAIVVVFSTLAAYAMTRLRFPGRGWLARGVLFVYLIPGSLMLIPMYLIIVNLRLKDTYLGLIIANMSFAVPFCTWLLMGYLRGISAEMEEAAMIDGCTRLGTLWHIVLPLSVPGLVTAAIFVFNGVWNEFIFALVLAQDESRRMISVGLSNFYRSDYYMVGPMMAGSLIAMAPVVILYILAQRYVVGGLAAGAVKG